MTQDFSGPSHSLAIKFDQTLETNFNTNGHALQLAAPKSGLNGAVKWNVTRRKQGRPFDLWDIVGQTFGRFLPEFVGSVSFCLTQKHPKWAASGHRRKVKVKGCLYIIEYYTRTHTHIYIIYIYTCKYMRFFHIYI
jgi:hypothetical protein